MVLDNIAYDFTNIYQAAVIAITASVGMWGVYKVFGLFKRA